MTRAFLSDYSTGILVKAEKRLRRVDLRNAPHCGAKWPVRGAGRPRAFILCFSRTAEIPRKTPQTPRRVSAGRGCPFRGKRRTQGRTFADGELLHPCTLTRLNRKTRCRNALRVIEGRRQECKGIVGHARAQYHLSPFFLVKTQSRSFASLTVRSPMPMFLA